MEIFSANFLETKRLSLMNSGDLYKMLHCKHYMIKMTLGEDPNVTVQVGVSVNA